MSRGNSKNGRGRNAVENDAIAPVDNLDLSQLPEHLHEWARNLELEASRYERAADEMKQQASVFAMTYFTRSILGEENNG